jgi:hypothetical protein
MKKCMDLTMKFIIYHVIRTHNTVFRATSWFLAAASPISRLRSNQTTWNIWNRTRFSQEPRSCTEDCVVHIYNVTKLVQQNARKQYL